ncbi:hypothetical protein, partial [Corallococcus llansteffanensis]|uniref:hypothetical protein n=1 Tax=Corallococcus llansteffanensis TaxID=2316731 RepID=UPI001ABF7EBD
MAGRGQAPASWPAMLRATLASTRAILLRHQRDASYGMSPELAHLYRLPARPAREPSRVSITRHLALTFRFVGGEPTAAVRAGATVREQSGNGSAPILDASRVASRLWTRLQRLHR